MTTYINTSGGNQAQSNTTSSADFLGDHDRNFKQESRRNKKFRFRKSDKHRRAENWISPCFYSVENHGSGGCGQ
jgi:hypothetical protein